MGLVCRLAELILGSALCRAWPVGAHHPSSSFLASALGRRSLHYTALHRKTLRSQDLARGGHGSLALHLWPESGADSCPARGGPVAFWKIQPVLSV